MRQVRAQATTRASTATVSLPNRSSWLVAAPSMFLAMYLIMYKASVLLPLPLVLAAVLSQFSAAVADTIGGGGNMVEVTKQHVTSKCAYILICGAAAVLAFVPTFTILALASRAFAFYYMMQCLVAITVMKPGPRRTATGFLAAILAFITVFAVPAG